MAQYRRALKGETERGETDAKVAQYRRAFKGETERGRDEQRRKDGNGGTEYLMRTQAEAKRQALRDDAKRKSAKDRKQFTVTTHHRSRS